MLRTRTGSFGSRALDLLQEIETAPARERDVEDDDVPGSLLHEAEGLRGVSGVAERRALEALRQDPLEPLAEERVVVGQEDACHSGIEMLTTVPRPGSP